MKEQYTAIQDQIGRTIIGKIVDETDSTLTINNPVILHCQPEASGQLQVQSFPVFFFEMLSKEARDKNDWTYNKSSIVTSNVELDDRILDNYHKINSVNTVQPTVKSPKVISINDLD